MSIVTNLKYTANLDKGVCMTPITPSFMGGDQEAHRITVDCYRQNSREAVDLSGAGVTAYFVRADGMTIPLVGETNGSKASVLLPAACYAVMGRFSLAIKLSLDDGTVDSINTVFWGEGAVSRSRTDVVIDPESVIPSLEELLAQIAAMEIATNNANTAAGNANQAADDALKTVDEAVARQDEVIGQLSSEMRNQFASDAYSDAAIDMLVWAEPDATISSPLVCMLGEIHGHDFGSCAASKNTCYAPYKITTRWDSIAFDNSIYKVIFVYYDALGQYIATDKRGWITASPLALRMQSNSAFCVAEFRRQDDADLTSDDLSAISLTLNVAVENTTAKKLEAVSTVVNRLDGRWVPYAFPAGFNAVSPVAVFTDGVRCKTDFDVQKYIGNGTTYYVAPSGTSSANDGLTPDAPVSFITAYNRCVDGDKIILLHGDYDRDTLNWGPQWVEKSISVIGQGTVRIFAGQRGNFAFVGDSVYSITAAYTFDVIDYENASGSCLLYEKLSTLDSVKATPGSWMIDGTTVYVHCADGSDPTGHVICSRGTENFLDARTNGSDVSCVFSNMTVIGKNHGMMVNVYDTEHKLSVVYDRIIGIYCGYDNYDTFSGWGGTVICNCCQALYSKKDGFNYQGQNLAGVKVDGLFVEIDCVAAHCGIGQTGQSQNGSTGHINAKIIRINGRYYGSYGGNVADVQEGCQSVNLCCMAYASVGTNTNENFAAQQADAEMWLDGCCGVGAVKDINCISGATMHLNNSTYKNKSGAGVIEETNPVDFDVYVQKKIAELL